MAFVTAPDLGFGLFEHIAFANKRVKPSARRLVPSSAGAIEPQPWMNRKVVRRWRSVPHTHSLGIVAGTIANSKALVTRSLHAGIFALAAGVPFVCIDPGDDPQSQKLRDYFQRVGIPTMSVRHHNGTASERM